MNISLWMSQTGCKNGRLTEVAWGHIQWWASLLGILGSVTMMFINLTQFKQPIPNSYVVRCPNILSLIYNSTMQHGAFSSWQRLITYYPMLQQASTSVTLEWTEHVSIHSGKESWIFQAADWLLQTHQNLYPALTNTGTSKL